MEKFSVAVTVLFHDEDAVMKEKIVKHLRALERKGEIRLWQKGLVLAGENPSLAIQMELERAEIALFLVSVDSIASDEIWKEEVERTLERHQQEKLIFIPVIIRDCQWRETVLINFKPLPEEAKPISQWLRPDEPCKQVADTVKQHVEKINLQKLSRNKQQGIVPPEFQEIDTIFQTMPDKKVMNHVLFTDQEGKPASSIHFSIYAQMLRDIEQRMRTREEYNFYVGNLIDAKEVENIAGAIRERADLLKVDTISLGDLCQELKSASRKFRDDFGSPENANPHKWHAAKVRHVEPFCDSILKIEKKLDTLSRFSVNVDLSDLLPN